MTAESGQGPNADDSGINDSIILDSDNDNDDGSQPSVSTKWKYPSYTYLN